MHLCCDVSQQHRLASGGQIKKAWWVGICVCVCVCLCLCVSLWLTTSINNQDPMLWGFGTMSSPVNRILATTSTINQDPAMWGFWIMSRPGSRFLDLLNIFYIQAIPTLWGFWIMPRHVNRVLVILYTTTPQPNTPTSYLPACRFWRWIGLLARTLRGFPNQSQIKSPAIRPPQVGNDGKAGPPGYAGKTATQPLFPWFCKYVLLWLIYCHLTTLIRMGRMDAHNKARQGCMNLGYFIFIVRSPSTAHHLTMHCSE